MGGIITISLILFLGILIWGYLASQKEKQIEQQKQREKKKTEGREISDKITANNKKIDNIEKIINSLTNMDIPQVTEYKEFVISNENRISEKGNDEVLYKFLKIDSFLDSFRSKIISDKKSLANYFNPSYFRKQLENDAKRSSSEKMNDFLQDIASQSAGNAPLSLQGRIDKLVKFIPTIEPTIESEIRTLDYYKNIALAMVLFYVNDKKIKYFEIYEAFEKLGVFNSTWQNNVIGKLDNIENRLSFMSNQLVELNQNFQQLVDNSQIIVNELQNLNSNIVTNNMLTAINTYQTWRLNANMKKIHNNDI